MSLCPLFINKKLTLDIIEKPKDKTIVEIDEYKISQVILNLLSNAIKFSPEGGTITVTYERDVWEDLDNTPIVKVIIIDQGIGIPEGEHEAIFNKFIQSSKTKTGAGGTGLGLAICKEIIESHNGIIYAEII